MLPPAVSNLMQRAWQANIARKGMYPQVSPEETERLLEWWKKNQPRQWGFEKPSPPTPAVPQPTPFPTPANGAGYTMPQQPTEISPDQRGMLDYATRQKLMQSPVGPPQPPRRNIYQEQLSRLSQPATSTTPVARPGFGKRLVRGVGGVLSEGLQGIALGPQGYQQMLQQKRMLPLLKQQREQEYLDWLRKSGLQEESKMSAEERGFEQQKALAGYRQEIEPAKEISPTEQTARDKYNLWVKKMQGGELTEAEKQFLGLVGKEKGYDLGEKQEARASLFMGFTDRSSFANPTEALEQFDIMSKDPEIVNNFSQEEIMQLRQEIASAWEKVKRSWWGRTWRLGGAKYGEQPEKRPWK